LNALIPREPDKQLVNSRRGRRRNGNAAPMAVITVPTLLRPTFSVPVPFSFTATGTVAMPSAFLNSNWKVTSVRATAGSGSVGTLLIQLASSVPDLAGPIVGQEVSAESRTITVSGGNTEIYFRNSRHVQHGRMTMPTIGIARFQISGALTVSGIVNVSFIGTF